MLIGRDRERDQLADHIARARTQSTAVLLEGPAGIGKTTLVEHVVEQVRAAGGRVLTARPTKAELPLPFAALGDLVRGLDLRVVPATQRRVLEIALGLRDRNGRSLDASELGLAFSRLVEAYITTDAGPAVVVLDDVQWVDTASGDVLTFAMRRLPPAGVCVITARRVPNDSGDGPFDVPEAERLTLTPLSADSIADVVRRAAATTVDELLLQRIVTTAAGNPLYAIELARTVPDPTGAALRPLPVPPSLDAAVAERVRSLPPATLDAMAAVSMLAEPTVDVIDDAGLLAPLGEAEREGIVEVRGRRITFTHPLLASAAYAAVPGSRRMPLHRALAEVTVGTERCIHLALGAVRPDASIAADLDAAVLAEVGRGAPAEAAALALLALDITPSDDEQRWGRRLLAADALFRAGRTEEAIAWTTEVVDGSPDPAMRARALLGLATIEYAHTDDSETAAALARRALAATDDPSLLADAHTMLARVIYTDFVAAAEHADAALALIRARADVEPLVLAQALTAAADARFRAGYGLDRDAFDQAIRLERGSTVAAADSAFGSLAAQLKYADELDESRTMLESLTSSADPGSLPYALSHLPQLHIWAGRWEEAERCARRHLEFAEQTLQESQVNAARFNLALVAAYRGEVANAEPVARALYDEGRAGDVPWTERNGAALLGFLAATTGDAARATDYLGRYDDLGEQMKLLETGFARFHADFFEALVAVGDIARAHTVVERLEARAQRTQRVSALAAARRGRALIAASTGDRGVAIDAARDAVEILEPTALVYDHARSNLTLGVVARRFKERSIARDALSRAVAEFERMGARSLAARAERELERVIGKAAQGHTLTPSEARVAELAAAGHTTRQIADELFISIKTVEANLTRVYRKLNISNRAQLANHLHSSGGPAA